MLVTAGRSGPLPQGRSLPHGAVPRLRSQDGSRAPLPPALSLRSRRQRSPEAGSGRSSTLRAPSRGAGRGGARGPFRGWAPALASALLRPSSSPLGRARRRASARRSARPGWPQTGPGRPHRALQARGRREASALPRIRGRSRVVTGPGRKDGGTMFSLKPPRPTFRSYLLPPPQVNNPFLAGALSLALPGSRQADPGNRGTPGSYPRFPVAGRTAARAWRWETRLLRSPHWLGGNL